MRTTVNLDDDVAAAVDQVRRKRHVGVSEAVNQLVRAGLARKAPGGRFVQRTANVGLMIDVTDFAEALELLDGTEHR